MAELSGGAGQVATSTVALPTLLVLASTYPRWHGDPEPGFVHELSKRLVDQFHVIVLCPHAPGALPREIMEGVEVVRYRYAPQRWETLVNDGGIVTNLRKHKWKLLLVPGFVMAQAWHAWRLSRRGKVDVVHAHWLIPQGLIAALLPASGSVGVPFLVTSHGADMFALRGKLLDALKRFVVRKASAVTVVSHPMQDALAAISAESGKVSVQPMGVDLTGRYVPDANVDRSANEILFVGRLVEKKGVRHLIAAMPVVLAARPDARLSIAGFGPDESRLRQLAVQLGVGKQVCFLGGVSQSELPGLYRRAAVFVAPFVEAATGDQEGLGLVLVEAIGCGCPVIAGDVPAVRQVFGQMGVHCVQACDAMQLASVILGVLDAPEEAGASALSLWEQVRQRFDWQAVAAEYIRLLHSCLSGTTVANTGGKKNAGVCP